VVFTDDQCQNGLVWVQPPPSGCTTVVPKHALRFTDPPYCTPVATSRDLHTHVHAVGALLSPQSGPFYRIDGSGACVTGGLEPSNAIPYSIGAEIPAASFATGTAGTDP
jgi:hypothetical protein